MSLVWLVTAVVTTAGGVRVARHRAHTAADLAALAAASYASDGAAAACRRAAVIAEGSGARLLACGLRGRIADVTVTVTARGPAAPGRIRLIGRARAGPVNSAVTWSRGSLYRVSINAWRSTMYCPECSGRFPVSRIWDLLAC